MNLNEIHEEEKSDKKVSYKNENNEEIEFNINSKDERLKNVFLENDLNNYDVANNLNKAIIVDCIDMLSNNESFDANKINQKDEQDLEDKNELLKNNSKDNIYPKLPENLSNISSESNQLNRAVFEADSANQGNNIQEENENLNGNNFNLKEYIERNDQKFNVEEEEEEDEEDEGNKISIQNINKNLIGTKIEIYERNISNCKSITNCPKLSCIAF